MDPAARARYERLATLAGSGQLPEDLVGPLETMLELLFEKGRPTNRAVLQSVYAKTPSGRQRTAAARDVNSALRTLQGQTITELRLSSGVSGFTLVVETDRCRVTLDLDRQGPRVASLETG